MARKRAAAPPPSNAQAKALLNQKATAQRKQPVSAGKGLLHPPAKPTPPSKRRRTQVQESSSEEEESASEEDDESLLGDDEVIAELRKEIVDLKAQLAKAASDREEQDKKMHDKFETVVRNLRKEKDALPPFLQELCRAVVTPPIDRVYSAALLKFSRNFYAESPSCYEKLRFEGFPFPDEKTLTESATTNGSKPQSATDPKPVPSSITESILAIAPPKPVLYVNPGAAFAQLAKDKLKAAARVKKRKRKESSEEEETDLSETEESGSFQSDPSDDEEESVVTVQSSEASIKKETKKRKPSVKVRFLPVQVEVMQKSFAESSEPKKEEIQRLADCFSCQPKRIRNWFQNERARLRKLEANGAPEKAV